MRSLVAGPPRDDAFVAEAPDAFKVVEYSWGGETVARRAYLGIDCGTQSTKALLLDAETEAVLAVGRAPHELIEAGDGTREQHPDWWVAALVAAVREALAEVGADAGSSEDGRAQGPIVVAGIGVSGQQHGLVCLDARDRPIRPAKLWNDTTTAADCATLTTQLGGPEAVVELIGYAFLPGYTAPKVSWLHRTEPDAYAATRRICLPHDYLNFWLTGAYATEPGDASGTAYVDVRARRYSEPVLAVLDADRDWSRTLPPIRPSLEVIGRLRPEAADALGLPAGIPVSGGGGDNACAAIGVGAVVEGPVVVSLGTSGTAFAHRAGPAVDPRGEVAAFCDSTGGWLPLVCTLNCTGATGWVRRLFGLDHAGVEASLAATPPGAAGLTFLPHLGGERTPDCPDGSGVFAGLRTDHGPSHIVRAVVEGVTFGLVYAIGALRRAGVAPTEITLVGGGAQSDGWAQLCADAFGVPVTRAAETEAAAFGAARQARWAVDGIAVEPGKVGNRTFEPRPSAELASASDRADHLRRVALAERL